MGREGGEGKGSGGQGRKGEKEEGRERDGNLPPALLLPPDLGVLK